MKKSYVKPQLKVIMIATNQILCFSGVYGVRQYSEVEDDEY